MTGMRLVASVIAVVHSESHIALMRILVALDTVDNITLAEQELRDARQNALCGAIRSLCAHARDRSPLEIVRKIGFVLLNPQFVSDD